MIYKRAVAKLRAQDWFAIAVELAIVIVGVFIGMQVSNWNEAASERREAGRACSYSTRRWSRRSNISQPPDATETPPLPAGLAIPG